MLKVVDGILMPTWRLEGFTEYRTLLVYYGGIIGVSRPCRR